jgi:hypothetical protein
LPVFVRPDATVAPADLANFAAAYQAARRQAFGSAVGRLQQASADAVDALRRNLSCGTPAAEIAAARAILEHARAGIEREDLAQRVEELERQERERQDREKRR